MKKRPLSYSVNVLVGILLFLTIVPNAVFAQYDANVAAPSEPRLTVSPDLCAGESPINTNKYTLSWAPSFGANYYDVFRTDGTPRTTGDGLYAEYFATAQLSGRTRLSRIDSTINFDWGNNSPDYPNAKMNPDNWSVRWIGYIKPEYSETYTFTTNATDGVRVWINNTRIINNWKRNKNPKTTTGKMTLDAGKFYNIKVEYFNSQDTAALLQLYWESPSVLSRNGGQKEIIPQKNLYTTLFNVNKIAKINDPKSASVYTPGLFGSYYQDRSFKGLVDSKIDSVISFDSWTLAAPHPSIDMTNGFAGHWTGFIKPAYSETYTFYVNTNHGVKLWINNKKIIDQFNNKTQKEIVSKTIDLLAGQTYDIELSYDATTGDNGYGALSLLWQSSSQAKEIIPTNALSNWSTGPSITGNLKNGIYAQYFYDKKLNSMGAAHVITPSTLNFNFGTGSPDPLVKSTNYSIRWSGMIKSNEKGKYRFYATGKDAFQVYVNGSKIINSWKDRTTPTTENGAISLEANSYYSFQVWYYKTTGEGSFKLEWEGPTTPRQEVPLNALFVNNTLYDINTIPGIQGKYWNNPALTNTPVISRLEPDIYFQWGPLAGGVSSFHINATNPMSGWDASRPSPNTNKGFNVGAGSPDPFVNTNNFSARFTGELEAPITGTYTFYTDVSDGMRMWINGKRILNNWPKYAEGADKTAQIQNTYSMEAGERYYVRIEYYENTGDAHLTLDWSIYDPAARNSTVISSIPYSAFRIVHTEAPKITYSDTDPQIAQGTDYAYQIVAVGNGKSTPSDWVPWAPLLNDCRLRARGFFATYRTTKQGQSAGPYAVSGPKASATENINFHNPLLITVNTTVPKNQTITERYALMYKKGLKDANGNDATEWTRVNFLKNMQDALTNDPKNGVLLAQGKGTKINGECVNVADPTKPNAGPGIPCSADGSSQTYVWNAGQWSLVSGIEGKASICAKGQTTCTNTTSLYEASSTVNPFIWEVIFNKGFGNKTLNTGSFFVTDQGFGRLDQRLSPSPSPLPDVEE